MKTLITVLAKADFKNRDAGPSSKLATAIYEANGNSSKFVLTSRDAIRIALDGEARLDLAGLPQADRVGFEIIAKSAGPRARAYKFSAPGTEIWMRRLAKGWALVSVEACRVFPAQDERVRYRAPAAMLAEISRRAIADIAEIKPARVAAIDDRNLAVAEGGYAA
jgi:hypothetical protein